MPAQLEVNKPNSIDNLTEYWWSVIFDMNDDAIVNEGVIELVLAHSKFPGTTKTMSDIPAMQANIAKIITSDIRYGSLYIGPIDVSRSGNTITLSASKSKYASELSGISQTTRVYFKSFSVDDTGRQHQDHLPSEDTYLEMTADGKFTDKSGDVNKDTTLKHEDLIAAEVNIN